MRLQSAEEIQPSGRGYLLLSIGCSSDPAIRIERSEQRGGIEVILRRLIHRHSPRVCTD
jgi:hypothetical protein